MLRILCGAALLLTACASPPPGVPAPAALVQAVAEARGVSFVEPPRVVEVSRETLRAEAERWLEEALPAAQAEGEVRLLAALGLVPEGYDLRAGGRALLSDALVALYDPQRRAIVAPAGETPSERVLLHELVHALQDQRFDLAGILAGQRWPPHELSDRALAWECLREGEAVVVASLAAGGASDHARRARRPLTAAGRAALSAGLRPSAPPELPPWMRLHESAPYAQGPWFVEQAVRAHGWAGVDALFRRLPASSEQVLHPEKALGERYDPPTSLELPDDLSGIVGGDLRSALTLGELGLRALFEVLDATPEAGACAGWDGDLAAIYEREGEAVLVWRLVWDSEADAREFHEALDRHRRRGPPLLRGAELTRHGRDVVLVAGLPPAERARVRARLLRR